MTGTPNAAAARDRYLDALRALALGRVIVFHMFGFAWLSYAFPALGVMFALGGSLMAHSLQRSTAQAMRNRIRRLLPALWVLGLVLVPAMLWHGWSATDARPLRWPGLLLWIVPLATPPSNDWAAPAAAVIWYLATYLWLVLLSPLAWWAYRRWPVPTALAPLAVLAATQLGPFEVDSLAFEVVVNVATFGACWVVGFAHRTGALGRLPRPLLLALAAVCLAGGAAWAVSHPAEGGDLTLNSTPLAQGLYSVGFVLVVLRMAPSMTWLSRRRVLDRFVTVLNARAVTIYLWNIVALTAAFAVGDLLQVWRLGAAFTQLGYFAVGLVLLTALVLLLGWVEDLAARRRPQLLPGGARRPRPPITAGHPQPPAAAEPMGPPIATPPSRPPISTPPARPRDDRRAAPSRGANPWEALRAVEQARESRPPQTAQPPLRP